MPPLYPPRDADLEEYRLDLRAIPSARLREDAEYWGWSLAEFDGEQECALDFADMTVEFCLFKLDEITRELARREQLKQNRYAPRQTANPLPKLQRYDAVKAHYHLVDFIRMVTSCRFRPSGERLVTNCPLGIHEDRTPSFTVYPDQHWHCFGCHLGGSIIDFFMAFYHLDREEALLAAEDEAGITPTATHVVIREGGEEHVL